MKTIVLPSGLKIIHVPRDSGTVCIEMNVRVGSNDEPRDVAGISHFIEHMLFEGTKRRPGSFEISNEIERLGGEFNAATSNDRTFFYTKVPAKHFDIALDIISDIITNPLFDEKLIEKEKNIVIDEIKLVNDQPRYFQWVLFQQALYRGHPAGRPIYGSIKAIEEIDRRKTVGYYEKHYRPKNMTLVIVGNALGVFEKVRKSFSSFTGKSPLQKKLSPVRNLSKPVTRKTRKDTLQAYSILGYNTVSRKHEDSYALDIIRAVAGRGQSGTIFNEIRTKRGLAYDVGVHHNPSTDFGFFSVYVNTNKKNLDRVRDIIIRELRKLKKITPKELRDAKTFLEGEYLLQSEDSQKLADQIAFWDQAEKAGSAMKYVSRIRKVTQKDVARVIDRYFKNYTMAVIY